MLAAVGVLVGLAGPSFAASPATAPADGPAAVAAAEGVMRRLIGPHAADFHFEVQPTATPGDAFDVSAAGGTVTVRGNSTVALTRGAYTYLRQACHCMDGWEGAHLDLPATLPDLPSTHVASPFLLRQEYNVCTLGYTTVYWDWGRWERELDWMALHGINMPLAEVGTEAIWQKVWLDMGITQAELDAYFTGPAYFPWHRMGNVNGWGGPLPAGFLDKQLALNKRIVARMRELGMKPIAPAFAGFVPPALHRVRSDAAIIPLAPWCGFAKRYNTYLLDPTSPLYPDIGRRFTTEWEKQFGKNQYFLADSFNELKVPVPPDRAGRLAKLAQYGDAVYRSVTAGDPDATWVMQGWLFLNDAGFWDPGSVQALLSKVPDDRMVILDLACDFRPIWPKQNAFFGKQWIYSVIHNFGGKTTSGGPLDFYANTGAATLADPKHGNLVGAGLAPEGTETNEVIYELATDAMWTRDRIDLDAWLPAYCLARYGQCSDDMRQAWALFHKSDYRRDVHETRPGFQHRPTTRPVKWGGVPDDSQDFHAGLTLFLKCGDTLKGNDLYRADAIDFSVQYIGSRIDALLTAALTAGAADPARRDRDAAAALELMEDTDALLSAHPIHRLDRWVGFARSWGDTPAESGYFEADAKRQITTWGGPVLSEYASKVWSGMVGGYYRGRWAGMFEQLRTGKPFNLHAWENSWIATPGVPTPVRKVTDAVAECGRLIEKADRLDAAR
jgi:alpha-N-acetylglucosaminidase